MAWDFSTDPEFAEQLDWMRTFVREEIWPIETIYEDLDWDQVAVAIVSTAYDNIAVPAAPGRLTVAEVAADHDLDSQCLGARFDHGDGLGVAIDIDQKARARILREPSCHRHAFGRGGRLVQHRGIRDLHAGEVDDHLLKI